MRRLTGAVCSENPEAVSDCFCEDGVYHDVFYGVFKGKENIQDLIKNYFYRDGCNFQWDIHDPISKGAQGYCRYIFSFESRLEDAVGKRTMFEGVSVVQLNGGLISHYAEVADTLPALRRLGFSEGRISRLADKNGKELEAREEVIGHL